MKSEFHVDHLLNALCFIYPGSSSCCSYDGLLGGSLKNLCFFPFLLGRWLGSGDPDRNVPFIRCLPLL